MVLGCPMAPSPSLISIIAELGFSTPEDLLEVQAREVIYGGNEETNLLELGLVSEDQLLDALARHSQIPRAEEGPLHVDPSATSRLLEAGVRAAAGATEGGSPVVYVNEALSPEAGKKVGELLGDDTEYQITAEVRVEEAIAYSEGQLVEGRASQLLDRLGTRLPPPPSVLPVRPPVAQVLPDVAPVSESARISRPTPQQAPPPSEARDSLPDSAALRPMSARMLQLEEQSPNSVNETAPPPVGYDDMAASATHAPVITGKSSRPPRPIYSIEEAESDLSVAKNRDRVVDILIHFAATQFTYTACFGVTSKEAKGLKATGEGEGSDAVKSLHVPLDLPSAFRETRDSETFLIKRLRASGLEGGIARDLGRPSGIDTFLLPIQIRGRTILLVYGDCGTSGIHPEQLTGLISFGRTVASALERVLLERKRASRVAEPPQVAKALAQARANSPLPKEPTPVQPAPETEPTVVVAPRTPKKLSPVDPEKDLTRTKTSPRRAPQSEELRAPETSRNSAAPPGGDLTPAPKESKLLDAGSSTLEVAPAKKRSLTRPGNPTRTPGDSEPPDSFPAEAPRTLRGFPKVKSPSQAAAHYQKSSQELRAQLDPTGRGTTPRSEPLMSRRIVPIGVSNKSEQEQSEVAVPDAPLPPVVEKIREQSSPPAQMQTPHGTLMSRRPPLPEPDEDGWDSSADIVARRVDPLESQRPKKTRSVAGLVRELLAGDEGTIEELLSSGDTAVGALIAEFPGPVTPPSQPSTKASECGPILKALIALGSKTTPFLTVRTADEDPQVRRWATFLLGELPGKESAKAIASRLLDDSIEVRRAALASARRSRSDALTRRTLRAQVEQLCRDNLVSIESRCSAVEALADIREHEAIPTLLQLLEDPDRAMQRATRWALSVLTRQDFGTDVSAWRDFWQEHRDEDRVEWLIQSLDHEQRDIRRAAGDELRVLAGEDMGFDPDQSAGQRRQAQAAFRTWWEEVGKAARP